MTTAPRDRIRTTLRALPVLALAVIAIVWLFSPTTSGWGALVGLLALGGMFAQWEGQRAGPWIGTSSDEVTVDEGQDR
jgi:hypothetical protein